MFHSLAAVKKEVYFMAIIDILTHYDAKKKAAHAAKTVKHGVSFLHYPLKVSLNLIENQKISTILEYICLE
jgi:hypothetical protein